MPRAVRLSSGEIVEGVPDDVTDEEVRKKFGDSVDYSRALGTFPKDMQKRIQEGFPNRFGAIQELLGGEGGLRPGAELSSQEFGTQSLGDAYTRLRTQQMDLPEEKVEYIRQRMPDADILQGSGGTILIKPPDSEMYYELDSPAVFNLGEMIDAAGAVSDPSNLTAIGTLFLTSGWKGVLGALGRSAVAGAGSYTGETAESAYNRLMGLEAETPMDVHRRALVQAGFEAGGELAGDIVRGGWKFISGQRPEMPPEIRQMMELASQLDMAGIRLGDVHPITTSMNKQAMMTTGTGLAKELERDQSFLFGLQKMAREIGAPEGVDSDVLGTFVSEYEKRVNSLVDSPRFSNRKQGKVLAEVTNRYFQASRELSNRLYDDVRDIAAQEDLTFNAVPAIEKAASYLRGTQTRFVKKVPGAEPHFPEGTLDVGGTKVAGVGPHGEVIEATPDFFTARTALIHDPAATSFLMRLSALTPEITHLKLGDEFHNAFEQLKQFRTEAFNLKDRGLPTDPMMNDIHSTLAGILDNPDIGSDAYKAALRKAEAQYRNHIRLAEKVRARQLLDDSIREPEKIGRNFFSPQNPDRVLYIRAMLGATESMTGKSADDVWDQIRGGYVTRLLRSPGGIENELRQWTGSEKALRSLVTPEEQDALTQFSIKWRQLHKDPVFKLYRESDRLGTTAVDAIMRGDAAAIDELVKTTGGKDTPFGKLLREGIFLNIANRSQVTEHGRVILSPTRARGLIDQLRRTGYLGQWEGGKLIDPGPILTTEDALKLDLFDKYVSLAPGDIGAGESLQAASLAASLSKWFGLNPRALHRLGANYLVARTLMADNKFTRLLLRNARGTYGESPVGAFRPFVMSMTMVMDEVREDLTRTFPDESLIEPGPIEIPPSERFEAMERLLGIR